MCVMGATCGNGALMNEFAIAAMGIDRPGIVAAVGEALLRSETSIEDSSMTILGGQFAMLLMVSTPLTRDDLEHALRPIASQFELSLEVRTSDTQQADGAIRDDWVVAAYGPDQPGLVSSLSRVLADDGANITDFGSRVGVDHTFAMWFNIVLTADTDIDALREQLAATGRTMELDVHLYRAEAEDL